MGNLKQKHNIKFKWLKNKMTLSKLNEKYLKNFNHCCVKPEIFTDLMDNNYMNCDDYNFANVVCDGDEVGTIGYFKNKNYKGIWLNWFVVYDRFQGKGISTATLQEFIKYIHKKFPDKKYLRIFAETPTQSTIDLYKYVGFVIEDKNIWQNIFNTDKFIVFIKNLID